MYRIYGESCNGQQRPVGIDVNPTFSWKLQSDGMNVTQASYAITVRDESDVVIWRSGTVASNRVHDIAYEGPALNSLTRYTWAAESVASTGEHACSAPQPFVTGILDPTLWQAQWIEPDIERKPSQDKMDPVSVMVGNPERDEPEVALNPAVYLRREVTLAKPVAHAWAVVTAHGIYELRLNGNVCGQPLAPGYTAYREYQEYQTYDVTELVHRGANVLGAIVADGWYLGKMGLPGIGNQYGDQLALLAQLFVTYEDGTTEVFGTDDGFRTTTGAFTYADLFVGEGYDARLEPQGWTEPSYDDSGWATVHVADHGYGQLRGRTDAPAGYLRVQAPARVITTPAGELVVDAGENVAGYLEIRGTAHAGDVVTLEYSEVLDAEGNFLKNVIGQNKDQTDRYTAAVDGPFSYRPTFTFHGFQYVRVSGIANLDSEDVQVYVLGSLLDRTGEFSCSDERLNQLQSNIFRSQQGNMLYVPTDCPQREKAGWTGDMQAYSPTALFNMDLEAFLGKWLANMRIEQAADGQMPHMVPDLPSSRFVMPAEEICSAGWADACVIVPWQLYRTYGDTAVLRDNYEMMLKWMAYVEHKAATEMPEDASEESKPYQRYLWNTGFHFGDWLIPSLSKEGVSNPVEGAMLTRELVAPAMWAYTTSLMAQISRVLGEEEQAERFEELNAQIRDAYAHVYANAELDFDFQGRYVLALAMNLVPTEQRQAYVDRLVEMIHANGDHLDTGFVSMPFLLDTLYENGHADLAWKLLFQDTCPSWLYEVKKGANTIWESWTNIAEDGTRNNSSYNHFSFGCVGDFMYRRILGLTATEPAYRRVRIAPDLGCGLSHAKGSFESVWGKISIAWAKLGNAAVLDVELPPNTSADIVLGDVCEHVGSGSYHFQATIA